VSITVPYGGGSPLKRCGHHDAGGPNLALDVAVLIEPPIHEVLVVGHGHVRGDDHAAHPADLGPAVLVHVLPQHGVVLFVQTDRVGDGERDARGVMQNGIEVADLAETVAAQFQRRGHEAEAPFADIEGGASGVIRCRVAVGNHHLRDREPVCDRPGPIRAGFGVAQGVQCHALAVVEPDPHPPTLPTELVAVQVERRSVRLRDLERLEIGTQLLSRHQRRDVLAHDGRLRRTRGVLDVDDPHVVQVDDGLEPTDHVGVGVTALGVTYP